MESLGKDKGRNIFGKGEVGVISVALAYARSYLLFPRLPFPDLALDTLGEIKMAVICPRRAIGRQAGSLLEDQ